MDAEDKMKLNAIKKTLLDGFKTEEEVHAFYLGAKAAINAMKNHDAAYYNSTLGVFGEMCESVAGTIRSRNLVEV